MNIYTADTLLSIQDAAKRLGVSIKTLQRWEEAGKVIPQRTFGNQRRYTIAQIEQLKNHEYPTIIAPALSPRHAFTSKVPIVGVCVLLLCIGTLAGIVQEKKMHPKETPQAVLGETNVATPSAFIFSANVPAEFHEPVTFTGGIVVRGDLTSTTGEFKTITANNILYSLTGGTGMSVTEGQTPTVNNTGVLSIGGSTGALSLSAGSGISVDGLTIGNTDTGSSQNIFKTIAISGQDSVTAGSNTDTLSFAGTGGVTVTTDSSSKTVTINLESPDYTLSGWTKTGAVVGLTTATDAVVMDSVLFGNATIATGKNILPETDVGSDLGSSIKRFNNLWVASINSNSASAFAGQTTFSYAPTDTTLSQASVIINPTTSSANGQLVGFAIAGYQKALIDAEGDMVLGYNGAVSAPISNYPLSIYGHNATQVASVDTSGNLTLATGANVQTTNIDNILSFDTTNNRVGVGTTAPTETLTIVGDLASQVASGVDGLKLTGTTDVTKLAMQWTGSGITLDVPSDSSVNKLSNAGFETDTTGWNKTFGYTLDDEFTTARAAGSVNGTQAEPTGGARTVADTESKLSLTGGQLSFSGGKASPSWFDPLLAWSSTTRSAGKMLLGQINNTSGILSLGWGTSATIYPNKEAFAINGTNVSATQNDTITPIVGTISTSTQYSYALVLRISGAFYFIKGGTQYPNWTLLYPGSLSTTTPLYPVIQNYNSIYSADNLKIPTSLWLPTPLAYDTFTTNGATSSETVGPDGQTTAALAWTGAITKAGGTMSVTPTLGSELVTNGTFDSDTGWTKQSLWTIGSGVASKANGASGTIIYQNVLTVGLWYQGQVDITSNPGGTSLWFMFGAFQNPSMNTTGNNIIHTGRASNVSAGFDGNTNTIASIDNVSFKPLTLSSLFSTVTSEKADVIADVNISALTSGTQAGLVLNLDSTSNPQNFVIAYLDGAGKVNFEKDLGGTYSPLFTPVTATYVAGATLRVIKDGLNYRVYYNNVLIRTAALNATTDANIINNTKHGVFSTYSGNTFDNFTLWPRSGFTDAPFEELTVTRDTSVKYAGSASVKLVAGGTDAPYVQPATLTDTSAYNLSAYAYTNGSAVTTADLDLSYGSAELTTSFTSVGNGWYKLSGTLTGVMSAKNYGVKVHAGKTVYVDSIALYATSGSATQLKIANSLTGLAQLNVESTTKLNSGLASLQALIVKGFAGQTANLQEWQSSTGTVLGAVDALGGLSFSRSTNSTTAYTFNNASGTSVLNIDTANSRVGIGTTAPSEALDVTGNIKASGTLTSTTGTLNLGTTNSISGTTNLVMQAAGALSFGTGGATNDMLITSTGLVGIGTTTPTAKLDVVGTIASEATAGLEAFKIIANGVSKLALRYDTNSSASVDVQSSSANNKFTNTTFDAGVSGWDYGNTLEDQFTTAAPTTLVSGLTGLTNGGVVTPTTTGNELLTDGGFENWNSLTDLTSWDETLRGGSTIHRENVVVHSGNYSERQDVDSLSSNSTANQNIAVNAGDWILYDWWGRSSALGKTIRHYDPTANNLFPWRDPGQNWVNYKETGRAPSSSVVFQLYREAAASASIYFDDASAKKFTLASLFSTINASNQNVVVSVALTLTPGTQSGLILNLDNATTPLNYVLAYHDGTNAHLVRVVNGAYQTEQVNSAAAYADGRVLTVRKSGTKYQLIYNGVQIGSDVTISDAGIINNTIHGLFSTYATNSFSNFLITTNLDGTQAEPTGGTRTVVDTNGKLSITGGLASFSAGNSSYTNPLISWPSVVRNAGKVLVGSITKGSSAAIFGWGSSATNYAEKESFDFSALNVRIRQNDAVVPIAGTITAGTQYTYASILRSNGAYYFIKGGTEYPNWTLLYVGSLTSTTPLYPVLSNYDSTLTADNIKIPTNLWLPTPLAYDTFTSAGLTTETAGPDGQATPSLFWTGGTKSGGVMSVSPSLGSEMYTAANASSDPNGNEANTTTGWSTTDNSGTPPTLTSDSVAPESGTYNIKAVMNTSTGARIEYPFTATSGNYYMFNLWAKHVGGAGNEYLGNYTGLTAPVINLNTAWTNHIFFGKATSTTTTMKAYLSGAGEEVDIDNMSIKPVTLSSLFSTVNASTANVIADVNVNLTVGSQAGLVLNLDSTSSPANFILVYHNGNQVLVDEYVAGAMTNKQTTTVAYSAGATLRAVRDGLKLRVYYNNALVGSELTMTANTNTNFGTFSTLASNTFDNFTLWARGSGGEYTDIPDTNLTVTNDTTKTYSGAGSAKIVATSGGAFTQSVNLGDTNTYTLSAAIYKDGTAVTTADAQLYAGNQFLPTTFTNLGNGWYRIKTTFTGIASTKAYGVYVHAGKTVYIDDMTLLASTDATSTFAVTDTLTGLGQLAVESTTTLNAGVSSLQALIVKGALSQTANLSEWQTSTGSVLGSVSAGGSAYFAGNVGIGTVVDATKPITTATGAYLSSSGVWTDNSSIDLKENFTQLDNTDLLNKIFSLSITKWNYKVNDATITHIGPTAEEFSSTFGVGEDNTHIAPLDTAGIALAGVKALLEKINNLFANNVIFQGTAIFRSVAEYFDTVILNKNVTIEGTAMFSKNAIGQATIPQLKDSVDVTFTEPYEATPAVTFSYLASSESAALIAGGQHAYLTNISPTGFRLVIPEIAVQNYLYNWSAVAVSDMTTTKSTSLFDTEATVSGVASESGGL